MPIYYITFILSFNNSNKLNINFKNYNNNFKDAFNLSKDKELDLKEDIILLKDNNSLFNFNSKLKEGTFFINIKEYLIQMSFIKPLILSLVKILKIPPFNALLKA
jgi:hypothetical protein